MRYSVVDYCLQTSFPSIKVRIFGMQVECSRGFFDLLKAISFWWPYSDMTCIKSNVHRGCLVRKRVLS